MKRLFLVCLTFLAVFSACAQEKPLDMKMDFEDYEPPSTLVVPEHKLTKAKFPFIDVHNHQFTMTPRTLKVW